MRTYAVLIFMFAVILYAQRDWFISLCAVIVFTALAEYPGLPNPLDARGINHWSVMVLGVTLGWLRWRITARPRWIIPRGWLIVMGLYLLLETIAITRLCFNLDEFKPRASLINLGYEYYTVRSVIVDCFYSPMRFLFLALLLLEGVRDRRQLSFGLYAVMAAVFIYALEVHRQVPLTGLADGGMQFRHRITKWTGRHPNDIAQDCAAMFWILIAFVQVRLGSRRWRFGMFAAAVVILLALAATHSRSGFLAFLATGFAVGLLTRSGRILGCLACAVVGVALFAPSITERMLEGFDRSGFGDHNMADVMAGRDIIWPAAIHGIAEEPLLGYGRYGYVVSSAFDRSLAAGGGETHPHNGFLEAALDHGVIGAAVIIAPAIYLLVTGVMLFRNRRDPLLKWAGLVGVSTATAALVAGFGGQHFVLYENYWVFWCSCALVVRATTLADQSTCRPAVDHSRFRRSKETLASRAAYEENVTANRTRRSR